MPIASGLSEIIEIPPQEGISKSHSRLHYYYNPIQLATHTLIRINDSHDNYLQALAVSSVNAWVANRWKHPLMTDTPGITSWSAYDHLLTLNPIYKQWPWEEYSSILYVINSQGCCSMPGGYISKILNVVRGRKFKVIASLILIPVAFLSLATFIFGPLGVASMALTIILGVVSNIIFHWIRK
jgi:hypothetical protein